MPSTLLIKAIMWRFEVASVFPLCTSTAATVIHGSCWSWFTKKIRIALDKTANLVDFKFFSWQAVAQAFISWLKQMAGLDYQSHWHSLWTRLFAAAGRPDGSDQQRSVDLLCLRVSVRALQDEIHSQFFIDSSFGLTLVVSLFFLSWHAFPLRFVYFIIAWAYTGFLSGFRALLAVIAASDGFKLVVLWGIKVVRESKSEFSVDPLSR